MRTSRIYRKHPQKSETIRKTILKNQRANKEPLKPWMITNLDPASREIPFQGKLLFTYSVSVVWFFLVIQSIILEQGFADLSYNPMLGPDGQVLLDMGGLNTEFVRTGDWWRIFWSPFLHAGVFHFMLNIILWVKLASIIEPDWGLIRTATVFMAAAVTGNLLSSTLDSDHISVGASGGIFGIIAACIPYIFEFWSTIPHPAVWLGVTVTTLLVGIASGFVPYVDNYAHMGGAFGGLMMGCATMSRLGFRDKRSQPESSKTKVYAGRNSSPLPRDITPQTTATSWSDLPAGKSASEAKTDAALSDEDPADKDVEEETRTSVLSAKRPTAVTARKVTFEEPPSDHARVEPDGAMQRGGFFPKLLAPTRIHGINPHAIRFSLRSTDVSRIDDSFDVRSRALWLFRIFCFLLLATAWGVLLYFLFVCPECYVPPGQLIPTPSQSVPDDDVVIPDNDASKSMVLFAMEATEAPSRDGSAEFLAHRFSATRTATGRMIPGGSAYAGV